MKCMSQIKVLIVDDEADIRNVIREYAENEQYKVTEASNGEEALEHLEQEHFDLMILDIMMPKLDGISLLEQLPTNVKVPTIILSARDDEVDKLTGFDKGIDDYVCKPFSPRELVARMKAVLQRTHPTLSCYQYQDLVVNFTEHTIKIDGQLISVTPKEFELLTYFIHNKKVAISRETLLNKLWGYDFYGDDRTIDTHIKMLRNNLGKYRDLIVTVRGVGYKFDDEKA